MITFDHFVVLKISYVFHGDLVKSKPKLAALVKRSATIYNLVFICAIKVAN